LKEPKVNWFWPKFIWHEAKHPAAAVKINLTPSPPLASTNKVIEVSIICVLSMQLFGQSSALWPSKHPRCLTWEAQDDGPSFELDSQRKNGICIELRGFRISY
jgi:hypothetical protein